MASGLAGAAFAETSDSSNKSGLEARLQAEIEELQENLARIGEARDSFLARMERLEKEQRLLRAESERLALERERRTKERDALRARIAQLERERKEKQERLSMVLVALHRMGPPRPLRALAVEGSLGGAMRGYRYLTHLTEEESALLSRLLVLREETRASEERLDETIARLDAIQGEIEDRRREISLKHAEYEALVAQLAEDEALRDRAVEEIKRARRMLSQFFTGVPLGPAVSGLLNIEAFRGLLPRPVEGEVAVPYGTMEHPQFRTRVPHNGLTFAAPRGAPVRSVFDGTVVYSGWFEGYGQTLILDHGHGYFTVYSHNDSLEKHEGDAVAKGDVIARAGKTGSLSGPQLYFELRKGARPLDPAPWFAKKP
jgi:septal ring factor EnvC (AmiA/AmiB activator)